MEEDRNEKAIKERKGNGRKIQWSAKETFSQEENRLRDRAYFSAHILVS